MRKMKANTFKKEPVTHPPPIKVSPIFNRIIRYSLNAGGSSTITRGNLLNCMLAADNAATTGVRVATSVLINKISIYGVSAAVGSPHTVYISYAGPNAPANEKADTGNAFTLPVVSQAPPPNSFASLWSQNNFNESEELATVSGGVGDIVDISIAFVIDNGGSNPVTIPATTTSGVFYSSPDNATNLRPVTFAWSGV